MWGKRFPDQEVMIDYTAAGDVAAGTAEVLYYLHGALGSVVGLADADGELVEKYEYDPYGRTYITASNGTARPVSAYGNPFAWTGQRYDPAVRLYHFWARSYSPALGRWLQRDPLEYVDGVGLYQYCKSASLRSVDPVGLSALPLPWWVIVGGEGGGVVGGGVIGGGAIIGTGGAVIVVGGVGYIWWWTVTTYPIDIDLGTYPIWDPGCPPLPPLDGGDDSGEYPVGPPIEIDGPEDIPNWWETPGPTWEPKPDNRGKPPQEPPPGNGDEPRKPWEQDPDGWKHGGLGDFPVLTPCRPD